MLAVLAGLMGCTETQMRESGIFLGKLAVSVVCAATSGSCEKDHGVQDRTW